MAVTRPRILAGYEIKLTTNTIQIEWEDRVVVDGEIVSRSHHRGAYELVNGDLPQHIQDEFGISLASLASEALLSFTKANAELRANIKSINSAN